MAIVLTIIPCRRYGMFVEYRFNKEPCRSYGMFVENRLTKKPCRRYGMAPNVLSLKGQLEHRVTQASLLANKK